MGNHLPVMSPCRHVEKPASVEEVTPLPADNPACAVELWDWTAIILTFPQLDRARLPVRVRLGGLTKEGSAHSLPDVELLEGRRAHELYLSSP